MEQMLILTINLEPLLNLTQVIIKGTAIINLIILDQTIVSLKTHIVNLRVTLNQNILSQNQHIISLNHLDQVIVSLLEIIIEVVGVDLQEVEHEVVELVNQDLLEVEEGRC